MAGAHRIVILTGAGLSAESGLSTFRDPDGIWSKYNIEDVATPDAFARNPDLVHDFYNQRRRGLEGITPNAAHKALAKLDHSYDGDVLVVTQNIDGLHAAAGSRHLIHMHGELLRALCGRCRATHEWKSDISVRDPCPSCDVAGGLRPDVVWFGEMPYHMERISAALEECTLFVSIGTSGHVYPAAGFVELARKAGAYCVELNLEPSQNIDAFDRSVQGPATSVVPIFVSALLGEQI